MYTTALQLLDLFGDLEIAQLAAPNSPAVDGVLMRLTASGGSRSTYSAADIAAADLALGRLNALQDDAGREVDSYLAPRYTLPLAQTMIDGSALPRKTADITRFLLMDNRTTEEVDNRYAMAIKWLRDVATNKASLGEQDTAVASPAGRPVVRPGKSRYDWSGF